MCTGLEIAGLAAGVGGTGLQLAGQAQQRQDAIDNARARADARNKVLQRTLEKNKALAEQSRDAFNNRLSTISGTGLSDSQAEETAKRQEALTSAISTVDGTDTASSIPISGNSSSSRAVKDSLSKRISEALESSTEKANKLGKLSAYGSTWLGQNFDDQEASRNISYLGNLAGGNASILPYLQDFAEQKVGYDAGGTNAASIGGSLLSGLGGFFVS